MLIITHRIAAASRCDRILVLDDGCVAEEGTHEQLVKHGGIYAAFAEEQQMEKELEEIEADPMAAGDAMARVAS